ncbi:MAG: hypothetical protein HWQ38_29890 [Nostoc sp. NMS7]|uniref:hypothetical protein n=1 Tax=Nostoc sp. NMS7 TaxID=2815391 RepID=UPI0025E83179|nr:hypothetical protein [Nostoc sp. NMS7]MBN3950452.1 hypothetical protein [Nostoc sp. NMS7]
MRIYFTTIVVIAIFGAGVVTANNTTKSLAQSTEKVSASTEMIEGLTVTRTEGSIIVPKDIEDLIAKSDIIAIGKPTQSITESTPLIQRDLEGYVTQAISQTKFKVQRVLKGASYSDTLLIGQQAAIVADRITGKSFLQVFEDYQPLVKNAKYILFLKKGLNGSPLYFPVEVYYGKFNVDGTDQAENKIENSDFKLIQKDVIERFKKIIDETSAS